MPPGLTSVKVATRHHRCLTLRIVDGRQRSTELSRVIASNGFFRLHRGRVRHVEPLCGPCLAELGSGVANLDESSQSLQPRIPPSRNPIEIFAHCGDLVSPQLPEPVTPHPGASDETGLL